MYNLTKIKPLALIAIVSMIILLMVIGVVVFPKGKKVPQPVEYKPSPPTKVNPVKLPQSSGFEVELSKIKSILPYRGLNYSIEFLKPVNIISVKIDASTKTTFINTKKQAEEFIRSKGVKDLCTLNIFWVSTKIKVNAKELITTGCSSSQKR